MAFRDALSAATLVSDTVSLIHEMFDISRDRGHEMLIFDSIEQAPGHRVAINFLTRNRICAAPNLKPEEFLALLQWAMNKPSTPEMVEEGPVQQCIQNPVDLKVLPIPHHWR